MNSAFIEHLLSRKKRPGNCPRPLQKAKNQLGEMKKIDLLSPKFEHLNLGAPVVFLAC
jgi:hypothetical protein